MIHPYPFGNLLVLYLVLEFQNQPLGQFRPYSLCTGDGFDIPCSHTKGKLFR